MIEQVRSVVEDVTRGSEDNRMNFSQVLQILAQVGVEGYYADLRRATKTYYLASGESLEVRSAQVGVPVAEGFDAASVEAAVRLSQADAHTYTSALGKSGPLSLVKSDPFSDQGSVSRS